MKTALDFYERGKLKESNADEYYANSYYPKGRFICPECGEQVYIRRSKYANFFFHFKRTDTTAECDRRVDGNSAESIYERIGLPLYIRQKSKNQYELFMGFKAVPDKIMNDAEINRIMLSIDGKMRYTVNRERFSTENSVLLPLNYIPQYGQKYSVHLKPENMAYQLYKQWSNYADGFSNEGALFTVTDQGGKKVRHGDNISSNTEYYWVRKQMQIPSNLLGVDMKLVGSLELSDGKWNVFRGKFISLKNDSEFDFLVSFLRDNMKIHLLEKASEFLPLWPPVTKTDDGYLIDNKVKQLYGHVVSGNCAPKIYTYIGVNSNPQELVCDHGIMKLNMMNTEMFINIDRKYISSGLRLCVGEKKYISLENIDDLVISEVVETENRSKFILKSNYLELGNADGIECVVVSQNGVISKRNIQEKGLCIELDLGDQVFLIRHTCLLVSVLNRNDEVQVFFIDEINLADQIKRYNNTYKVRLPYRLRAKLLFRCWKLKEVSQYIDGVLIENKISLPMINVLEETLNGENRS